MQGCKQASGWCLRNRAFEINDPQVPKICVRYMTPQRPTAQTRRRMRRQRSQNTKPELTLRSELHRRGLRYRLQLRIVEGTFRRVDIVFTKAKLAIFVDGCFWHSCPEHGTEPSNNRAWWREKLRANALRDEDTNRRLQATGWRVLRVWEHEDMGEIAERVERLVKGEQP